MEAYQYIYTSWKNGNSPDKGYMIYSRSNGLTEEECAAIKDVMQYLPPKGLGMAPSAEEIAAQFPYSFASFTLPSGRGCTAQSTYLGKDYSGRFGNYIIYAIVYQKEDLPCRTAEFFAEQFMKTSMTQEELDASSPVPPLPLLADPPYGGVINEDQINEFVYDRIEEFSSLLALLLSARDEDIPFYINDSRENLVLWAAAVQRVLPEVLWPAFAFSTYVGNHEALRSPRMKERGLDFAFVGVRPDANYFNYAVEAQSSRHRVIDFLGGHMSQGIAPGIYTQAMAESAAMDFSVCGAFSQFLEGTAFREINGQLETAYRFFRIINGDAELAVPDNTEALIRFGSDYCGEPENAKLGECLLSSFRERGVCLEADLLQIFWFFAVTYAGFMVFSLYDLVTDSVYSVLDQGGDSETLTALFETARRSSAAAYAGYLAYVDTDPSVEQLLLLLQKDPRTAVNNFYIQWLLKDWQYPQGLREAGRPVVRLLRRLLQNVRATPDGLPCLVHYLFQAVRQEPMLEDMLDLVVPLLKDPAHRQAFSAAYEQALHEDPDAGVEIERRLFQIPEAADLAAELSVNRLLSAKNREDAYWSFFRRTQKDRSIPDRAQADVALAVLRTFTGSEQEKLAVKMLETLPDGPLKHDNIQRGICEVMEHSGVKALSRLEQGVLDRAYGLCTGREDGSYPTLRSVWVGSQMKTTPPGNRRPDAIQNLPLSLLSRRDYEVYLKLYLRGFLDSVTSCGEMSRLLNLFYRKGCTAILTEVCLGEIRQSKRTGPGLWKRKTAWLCAFAISENEAKWEEFRRLLLRWLRKLNETEINDVQNLLQKEVPAQEAQAFLSETRKKETIQNLIGGIFHRKP